MWVECLNHKANMTLISTIFLYWDYLRNIIEKILCIYIEVKIQQLFLENTSIVFIRNDGTIFKGNG